MAKSKVGAVGGNEAGHLIASVSGVNNMTGTTAIVKVIDIDEVDNISFDVSWTGTPTGTFIVEVSNSYLPNPKDLSGQGTAGIRVGSWNPVTSTVDGAIVNPAGASGKCIFGFNPTKFAMAFSFMRLTYTNSAGTGQLDVWMSGKAIGA
ncbi:MAG TPA: hypothetical protein VI384_04470 [Candidatus Dormibacteraeota bacterium]